jgi:hypothetical protein
MTSSVPPLPGRAEVEDVWESLLARRITREDAHDWTVPWVEGVIGEANPMVLGGLEHLHGFDLRYDPERPGVAQHGRGGPYMHSEQDIADALARWRLNCARYDADPVEYVRAARERARSMREAEQKK